MTTRALLPWLLLSSVGSTLACSTFACSSRDSVDGAETGGAASGGATSGGSTGAGGAASGGSATGGSSGGTSNTGGTTPSDPPDLDVNFADENGFTVVGKSELIPGATATLTDDAGASDGKSLRLTVPGDASLTEDDYVGPGAHAIEIELEDSTQLYGRYEVNVRFPECEAGEELVSGIFTYFNDGSDQDEDDVGDNSEIDIEHLCGDPAFVWLTVWTDYEGAPTERFARTSRLVNMRTGAVQQTPLGGTEWGGLEPAGSIAGLAVTDFPNPDAYYHFGFEWRAGTVRYFFVSGGQEIELWTLTGEEYVPQRPATFLVNLWHPGEHWSKAGSADFPANDGSLFVDWIKIWE